MHVNAVEVIAAIVLGGAASAVGGYLGGTILNSEAIGKEMAGYMGMLYGPPPGLAGVIIGTIAVVALFGRS